MRKSSSLVEIFFMKKRSGVRTLTTQYGIAKLYL